MSLIMDATKAAQREKERREGKRPDAAPLLVPLRARPTTPFSWGRMLALAGSGVAVVGAGYLFVVQAGGGIPRALRTPGPTVVSIASPPTTPTADSAPVARQTPATPPTKQAPTARGNVAGRAQVADRPPRTDSTIRSTPAPAVAAAPSTARDSAPAPSGGQLRIAVAQPRELEAARLFAAGVAAHRAGDLATARALYEQALAIVPGDGDVLNNLGVLYLSQRNFERAEAMLRRALSVAPGNAGAWNNLGTVLRERGRSADAVAAFQRALAIAPGHTAARISLAQQYLVIGALPQARQFLEEVLTDLPNSPEANYALGQVLERQGDRAGAARAYTTFIRVAPPTLAPYVEGVRRRVDALSTSRP